MKLVMQGFIFEYASDSDDIVISDNRCKYNLAETIQRRIEKKDGVKSFSDYKRHLGRNIDIIDGCSIRLYFTDKKCTVEDADLMVATQFDGKYFSDIDLMGYSEFTITGYEINKCEIGGHKLVDIIKSHLGEYMVFVMEW